MIPYIEYIGSVKRKHKDIDYASSNVSFLKQEEWLHKTEALDVITNNYIHIFMMCLKPGLRFGDHDQEHVHTLVNQSCTLALQSVTYFIIRSDQSTTELCSQVWSKLADLVKK